MTSKTILVTGAGGFLGQAIVRALRTQHRVIGCYTRPDNIEGAEGERFYFRLPSPILHDVLSAVRPSWVIHAAGSSSVAKSFEDPDRDFATNVLATESVYEAVARCCPTAKVLFLSSAAVYGQPETLPITEATPTAPLSPYAYHKRECEWVGQDFRDRCGLSIANLRIFSAYGPGLRKQVLWDIFDKSRRFRTVVLDGTGDETRDFVHVNDIIDLIQHLIRTSQLDFDTINVGSGRSITIRHLAELFLDSLSYSGNVKFTGILGPGIPTSWSVDISKAKQFGFDPKISLEDGIADYRRWACQTRGDAGAHSILAAAG